jgi:ERCC4-type nuclease
MEMIIDYRERPLIDQLKREKIEFKTSNLQVGDIQIFKDQELLVVIERKTAADYVASIKDRRLKNQIARTNRLKEEHPHSILIILVEGSFQPSFGQPVQISDFIYNSILNRMLTDRIPVIRADNLNETVVWLKKIAHKLQHDIELVSEEPNNTASLHYLSTLSVKKSSNMNPHNCFLIQLAQIPGVSLLTAQHIANFYGGWPELVNQYQEETNEKRKELLLANIMVGHKRLGKVLSSKIYQYLFPKRSKTRVVLRIKE